MKISILGCAVSALALAFAPASLMAQDGSEADSTTQQIKRTPIPDWVTLSEPLEVPENAQGAAFVRYQDTLVHLTSDGARSFQSQNIRILNSQALQSGNIAITWNPAAGEAQIHALRIYRGSRVIDVLESTQFEILRREDQLEQAMLTGNLTATLRVPDLRVGDDLELAFSVPLHDPTLKDTNHGILFLADAPPEGRFRLGLTWTEGAEPIVRLSDDLERQTTRSENGLSYSIDNPSAFVPPRDAPARYSWSRSLEFSEFAGWSEVSRRFYPLFAEASTIAPDSPLREEAQYIAADHKAKLAQAQAALTLVQQQVRYVYVGLNGGNYSPASADLTWQRRYGDCKGKTAMLLALLKELGIEAEGVLVANSVPTDGLDERLANPAYFDHIIVRATIDGKQYWLDGTLPEVIEAREQPFFPYQWVLPLSQAGKDIERLPETPLALPDEMSIFEADASAGFDQPAKITWTFISRGAGALATWVNLSSLSQNQLETSFRNQLLGGGEFDTIDRVSFRFNRETQASIWTVSGTGELEWEDGGGEARSLVLPGGGFSPPVKRQRPETGASQDAPYWQAPGYSCYVTTIRLPKETSVNTWDFNTVFETQIYGRLYYRMMELRRDKSLRMIRGSRVETTEISAAAAARDNDRLDDFDNSKAILYHYPDDYIDAWDTKRPVPSASEIDWSGAKVPCLPPQKLKP